MKQSKAVFSAITLALLTVLLWRLDTTTAMVRPEIKKQAFGMTESREAVELYTLTNANGTSP